MKQSAKHLYIRLFWYSRPYLWRVLLAVGASVCAAGPDIAMAKLLKPFVDKILVGGNWGLINLVPIIIIGLAVVKGAGRYVQEYFIKTAGQLVVQDIRNDLYSHSLSLSMGYFCRSSTGNVMSRILNDVGALQRSSANVLVDGVRESVLLVGLVVTAFQADWRLAAIAFLVLPLAVLPATLSKRTPAEVKKP